MWSIENINFVTDTQDDMSSHKAQSPPKPRCESRMFFLGLKSAHQRLLGGSTSGSAMSLLDAKKSATMAAERSGGSCCAYCSLFLNVYSHMMVILVTCLSLIF